MLHERRRRLPCPLPPPDRDGGGLTRRRCRRCRLIDRGAAGDARHHVCRWHAPCLELPRQIARSAARPAPPDQKDHSIGHLPDRRVSPRPATAPRDRSACRGAAANIVPIHHRGAGRDVGSRRWRDRLRVERHRRVRVGRGGLAAGLRRPARPPHHRAHQPQGTPLGASGAANRP